MEGGAVQQQKSGRNARQDREGKSDAFHIPLQGKDGILRSQIIPLLRK
jgi:hypothetical protein